MTTAPLFPQRFDEVCGGNRTETTILLGKATATAVQDWAPLQAIGQVQVRGKQEPVQVYVLKSTPLPR